VLAFADAPLADVPDSGGGAPGLTADELVTSLATFAASDCFAGLVLTEVNPDHIPEPGILRQFLERLSGTLAA
jgi:arginase